MLNKYKIEIELAQGEGLIKLLEYIKKIGNYGHSFSIIVDPDDSEYEEKFNFDGDGADHIKKLKIENISEEIKEHKKVNKNIIITEEQYNKIKQSLMKEDDDFNYGADSESQNDNSNYKEFSDSETAVVDKIDDVYPEDNAPTTDQFADTLAPQNYWWSNGINKLNRV